MNPQHKSTWHPPKKLSDRILVVLVPGSIVVGTLLTIWLLHPGGYSSKQPRISWLIGFAVLGAAIVTSLLRNIRAIRTRPIFRITIAVFVAVIGAGIAAYFWPGGLVKKYPKTKSSSQVPTNVTTPNSVPYQSTSPSSTP